MKTTTKARVQVTVELELTGTWGGDCPTEQIFKQGGEEAIQTLREVLNLSDGLVSRFKLDPDKQPRVRIIGAPHVIAITTERP